MGCGKTYIAEQFIKSLPTASVTVCITFRISLAKYLAERLNLNCYLDQDIWSPQSSDK
ncbi:hypothetical protein BDF20DRAFT_800981, partial [Mycotypha africana]|uniref:uncharacterized protein n=1 Tax=Mycotypha africana TaxID=64632 RepID=UPI002301AD99